jgi:hypothetical protein
MAQRTAREIVGASRGGWATERPVQAEEKGAPVEPNNASCGWGEQNAAEDEWNANGDEKRSMALSGRTGER